MNILYHHRTLADGAEGIHIHEMVEAFRALGHQVDVRTIGRPRAEAPGRAGVLGALRKRMPQTLFECAALGMNLSDFIATRRRLRAGQIDLVYKRHALLDVGSAIAARRCGVPLVLEVNMAHSAASVRQFEPIRLLRTARAAERYALRSATLVVAVSTPLAAYLRELAGPDLPVLVLPNGANTKLFDSALADGAAIRARYGLHGQFVVAWAGVLRRWHGTEVVIDALAETPAAHLLIIGDGPDRPRLEQYARERGVSSRMTVTGRVAHTAIPSYLAASDAAVAAGDRTGFASPMKIVEYMAMGLPVLAPRLRNLEDLIDHDRTGLFFRAGDGRDLARSLSRLQASATLRERLGQGARGEVRNRLNWPRNVAAIFAALKKRPG